MNTLTADQLETRLQSEEKPQLVDVLSRNHYEQVHLAGAQNLPLDELEERARDELDPTRPVVVYCASRHCGLSPRAAELLDEMGFQSVYDFEGGIAEWLRSGRTVVRTMSRQEQ